MKPGVGEVGRHWNELQPEEFAQAFLALTEHLGLEVHRVPVDQFGGTEIEIKAKDDL